MIVFLLGAFGIANMRYVNRLDLDIRTRWLPSTSAVGDLNNYTSDFPAAERAELLASSPTEFAAHQTEMADLDRAISRAQDSYEGISHDEVEKSLFNDFSGKWQTYRRVVSQELTLLTAKHKNDALTLYRSNSIRSYNAASDSLEALTNRTFTATQEAGKRAGAAFGESQMLIVLALVCAALLTAAALVLLNQRFSKPLLNMSECIRRLAGNDMDVQIADTGRADEMGEIARAIVRFRDNAIELAASQRWLSQQASALEEKLADGRRAALLQRNFVSMASHEFRTPLSNIDAHAQRLLKLRGRLEDTEFADRISKIRRAVLRLTNVVSSMIETSRIDEHRAQLYFHPSELDLRDLLDEVCRFHQEIAPRSISERFRSNALRLVGDQKLLFQVFSNLLSNAIKYSPADTAIDISARVEGAWITVIVRDHGIGIPVADIPRLFDRFYRGSNAGHTVGTGIGLYFVKIVVEMHGGEIAIASRENVGTTITVRLPGQLPTPPDRLIAAGKLAVPRESLVDIRPDWNVPSLETNGLLPAPPA